MIKTYEFNEEARTIDEGREFQMEIEWRIKEKRCELVPATQLLEQDEKCEGCLVT